MAQRQTMQRSSSVIIPPVEEESILAHISRSSKNAVYSCFGCLQTSKEKALIKYKEYEIEERKKSFGVTYINHKKQGQDDALPECVEAALKDIENFEQQIEEFKSKVASVNEETKSRIVPAPGSPAKPSGAKPSATPTPGIETPAPETALTPPETAAVTPPETSAAEASPADEPHPPLEAPVSSAPTAAVATETSPPAESTDA